jgi:cyclase
MLKHRVIPSLLLSNNELVKTQKFSKPRYVGDPINAIRIFNEKEVDELMILDIDASKQGREPNYALIEKISSECFMPLCYGGGIKDIGQASKLFTLGIEKVSLQTSAIKNIDLVSQLAKRFGSQSVVVSVDIKKDWRGRKRMYSSSTNKLLDLSWQDYFKALTDAGAGEVVLNSVDRDGMMGGMDLDLIREAAQILPIPMIAAGGVGSLEDIKAAVQCGASAVAVGSFFVFSGPHRAVLITYPKYKNLEMLLG